MDESLNDRFWLGCKVSTMSAYLETCKYYPDNSAKYTGNMTKKVGKGYKLLAEIQLNSS